MRQAEAEVTVPFKTWPGQWSEVPDRWATWTDLVGEVATWDDLVTAMRRPWTTTERVVR